MIINNRYYNDDNIIRIYFKIESSSELVVKYRQDGKIWSHNLIDNVVSLEDSYSRSKVVTDSDISKAEHEVDYKEAQEKAREESHNSRGMIIHNRHDRDLEEAKSNLERLKRNIEVQKKVFNSMKIGEFNSTAGYIDVFIETASKTFQEQILAWSQKEVYENREKVTKGTKKLYKDDITIEGILKQLKGRTEI
jgi:hypothetical protein